MLFAGNSLETIGAEAFMSSGLETFVAPASLRQIGDRAFFLCHSLRSMDLSSLSDGQQSRAFMGVSVFEGSSLESV